MMTRRTALAAGVSLAAWLAAEPPVRAASCSDHVEGRVRLPDGRWLGYSEYGNPAGPLVLYFHGVPSSRLEAGLIADEAAATGVRLVAPDRPGIGISTYQPGRRILDWPADVECLVAALGYGDSAFGVIGFSGGAPYAAACICRISQRLTHVAIVSGHTPMEAPGVQPGNEDNRIERFDSRPRLARLMAGIVSRRLETHPDKMAERVAKTWSAADRHLIMDNPQGRAALIANLREVVRCDTAGVLTDTRLLDECWGFALAELPPTSASIWQGGCDPVVTPSMGRYFSAHIAGSELFVDPGAGHLTMLKWHAAEIMTRFT